MSLAQELNEIGEYGYIKFADLIIGQKYKVYALKSYESNMNNLNRNCLRVDIDKGYLILPERFDEKVKTINSTKVENLYIAFYGRGKGNRLDIRFYEIEAEAAEQNQA